jgi:hypothetical protein
MYLPSKTYTSKAADGGLFAAFFHPVIVWRVRDAAHEAGSLASRPSTSWPVGLLQKQYGCPARQYRGVPPYHGPHFYFPINLEDFPYLSKSGWPVPTRRPEVADI